MLHHPDDMMHVDMWMVECRMRLIRYCAGVATMRAAITAPMKAVRTVPYTVSGWLYMRA